MSEGKVFSASLIVILFAAAVWAGVSHRRRQDAIPVEMRAAGCRIVDYAGRHAEYAIWECPGYRDRIQDDDWTGPREAEHQ